MREWREFVRSQLAAGATAAEDIELPLVGVHGDADLEYRVAAAGPGLVDRSYRGLLRITGSDRKPWLHNLTTNHVTTLGVGDGNHAFALNLQGRILFDLNVLVREDSIWVDLDRRFLERALAHFDKYRIIEDVQVSDASDDYARFALVGLAGGELASRLGAPHAARLPDLGSAELLCEGASLVAVRNDFCGQYGLELYVPAGRSVEVWRHLIDPNLPDAATPVGHEAVRIHRIEAGLPWPGLEITDDYLPAETGRVERAVSYNKGCYLGQEVVERMRSRDVVARQLVGLKMNGIRVPPFGAEITSGGKAVGAVTSSCRSPAFGCPIALGYVKTTESANGSTVQVSWDGQTDDALVTELPMVPVPAM